MAPRDTRTGDVLERMVLPALEMGGYTHQRGVNIGTRPSGGQHVIDILVDEHILVSMKWQQTSGTAEQKIPFEVICLIDAINRYEPYDNSYLVLGGDGWTLRDYYCSGGLNPHINGIELVNIQNLESFVRMANQGQL